MKTALVCGAGGFIGGHLVKRLKEEGYWVRGVDIKNHEFIQPPISDDFVKADLRDSNCCYNIVNAVHYDEIYQLAANMGGAGFVFTGENDADIMHNSALINLNILSATTTSKIFFASSACVYPEYLQLEENAVLSENMAYPAAPDSEYGWEKLFGERLYLAYHRNRDVDVRIARFHNIFGPQGTYKGGREKAPAAICRKVIESTGEIEIWGDGNQTRSFLYIDEAIEGVRRLMNSEYVEPINIGSEEQISINDLAKMVMDIADKNLTMIHIDGPQGVRGRSSDNTLIKKHLGWAPSLDLKSGMEKTYEWIRQQ